MKWMRQRSIDFSNGMSGESWCRALFIQRPIRSSWAPKHIRPLTPRQVIREYTYVYVVVAPKEGKMASLILPSADTSMMNLFLQHVSQAFSNRIFVSLDAVIDTLCDQLLRLEDNAKLLHSMTYFPHFRMAS